MAMMGNSDVDLIKDATQLAEVRGRSLWQDAWARFFRNKAAVAGLIVLIAVTLFAIFGSYFAK